MWDELVPYGSVISPPLEDPVPIYTSGDRTGHAAEDYRAISIPPTGMTQLERDKAHEYFKREAEHARSDINGWNDRPSEEYASRLSWLLDTSPDNTGDPFQRTQERFNSKACERAVLDYFAALWNGKWPHKSPEPDETGSDRYWGYVLSMGRTEANIHGLFNARDYLKGRLLIQEPADTGENLSDEVDALSRQRLVYADPIPDRDNANAYRPIVFYSADVHYSIVKAVRLLELTTFFHEGNVRFPGQCPITINGEWPEQVPSHDYDKNDPLSGTIRIDDLTTLVRFFAARGYPIVIVLNLGTTWKGAFDDVPAVDKMLRELKDEFPWLWERPIRYNTEHPEKSVNRRCFWVHVDGAQGAAYLPFIEMAHNRGMTDQRGPVFDFRNESVMSIGCSVQKWVGGPSQTGVYMTRCSDKLSTPEMSDILHETESTLAGSRSGLSPMIMWDYISRISYEQCMQRALQADRVAEYLESRLRLLESNLRERFGEEVDLWVARSRLALTVRFRLVNRELSEKWSLNSQRIWVPVGPNKRQTRTYSHLFVRAALTAAHIDRLIEDLESAASEDWHLAFPETDRGLPNPGQPKSLAPPSRSRSNGLVVVPFHQRDIGVAG